MTLGAPLAGSPAAPYTWKAQCSRPEGANVRRAIGTGPRACAGPSSFTRSLSTRLDTRRPAAAGTSNSWVRLPTRPAFLSRTTIFAW